MRKFLTLLCFVPVFLAVSLYLTALRRAHLARAEAMKASDPFVRAEKLAEAIRWRAPFIRDSKVALTQAQSLVSSLPSNTFTERADKLRLVRELESSITGSRSWSDALFPSPYFAVRDEWRAIEAQLTGSESQAGIFEDKLPPKVEYHYQLLAQLFFWGWILSAVATIRSGLRADGSVVRVPFIGGSAATLVLFAFWCLALTRA